MLDLNVHLARNVERIQSGTATQNSSVLSTYVQNKFPSTHLYKWKSEIESTGV